MKTRYEQYVEKQMEDPEFRAYYILSREKTKLEFMLADLEQEIDTNFEKKQIQKRVKSISRYVRKIGMNE